ncbi:MAG: hypothetical protein FWE72_03435 [Spirochaetaceae bacterium]|nr:hypothetical protein [Spirochaetaceae bacterium]
MNNRLIILQVLLLCALSLGFISCGDPAPDLSMYRGIDYIEKYKFTSDISLSTASWTFNDSIAPNGYHYMGFNSSETGATTVPSGINQTGLPNDAIGDISRLEVFNLVHDGGFEFDPALTGWSPNMVGTIPGAAITRELAPDSIGSTCLKYVFDLFAGIEPEYIRFNMGPSTIKDRFLTGNRYIIRLNFYKYSMYSNTPFRFNTERDWKPQAEREWGFGYTKFPDASLDNSEVVAESSDNYFYVLFDDIYNSNNEGYIDDFRIVRSDIDYYLKLTVPYSEAGRPDLPSGTYRFSVWFKAEDPADASPSPTAPPGRFNSSRISLGIGKTLTTTTVKGFVASETITSGSWSKLSVEKFIQIRDGDSLVLLISPADRSGGSTTLDIGSVLIAFPELYYISE